MKGTIEIVVQDRSEVQVHYRMKEVSSLDKAILMDAMARTLNLNEVDRMAIGALIGIGGFGALSGKTPTELRFDVDMIEKLRKKENNNETDVL